MPLTAADASLARTADLARALEISPDELSRLQEAWGSDMIPTLQKIGAGTQTVCRAPAGWHLYQLPARDLGLVAQRARTHRP